MKTRLVFLVLLFVVLALNTPVAAQSVTVKVTGFDIGAFPTVRAFISVTDASGHAIQTLSRDAFKMAEDGRDAPVVAVSASQEPIHVGLVIDHSGSMGQENKLPDAKIAASAFVDEMRAQDEAFVSMFDDTTDHLQDFTSDHTLLKNAIARINTRGGTAFYDAVYNCALKYETRKEQRKNALILLTDGLDNREQGGGLFGLFGGAGSKHTLDEAIAKAKEMKLAVYTIGLGTDADRTRLQRLANETGGKFFLAPRGDQLKELYRLIAEQLQKEYAVDFRTPRPLADGTQRRVQVTITLPTGGTQTADGLYVAGFLFNRIHADWLIGALLALVLLTMGILPTLGKMLLTPRVVPAPAQTPPPISATAPCPHCGRPVRVGARFCGSCGRTLVAPPAPPAAPTPPSAQATRCPRCGNQVRPGAKFCGKCQYQLRG